MSSLYCIPALVSKMEGKLKRSFMHASSISKDSFKQWLDQFVKAGRLSLQHMPADGSKQVFSATWCGFLMLLPRECVPDEEFDGYRSSAKVFFSSLMRACGDARARAHTHTQALIYTAHVTRARTQVTNAGGQALGGNGASGLKMTTEASKVCMHVYACLSLPLLHPLCQSPFAKESPIKSGSLHNTIATKIILCQFSFVSVSRGAFLFPHQRFPKNAGPQFILCVMRDTNRKCRRTAHMRFKSLPQKMKMSTFTCESLSCRPRSVQGPPLPLSLSVFP